MLKNNVVSLIHFYIIDNLPLSPLVKCNFSPVTRFFIAIDGSMKNL